jgi:hypothetical protein
VIWCRVLVLGCVWVGSAFMDVSVCPCQVEPVDLGAQAAARKDVSPDTVASIILGGGAGTRLFPLTRTRAKPAVMTLVLPPPSRSLTSQISLFLRSSLRRMRGAGVTDNRDSPLPFTAIDLLAVQK